MSISPSIGQKPATTAPGGGVQSRSTCAARAAPAAASRAGSHARRAPPARGRGPRASPRRDQGNCAEPPWPLASHPPKACCAGGRQIPRPRSRQSQLPGRCLVAPGMNCLTHRAAPPMQSRDAPAPRQCPRHALPACRAAGRAGCRAPRRPWPAVRRCARAPASGACS